MTASIAEDLAPISLIIADAHTGEAGVEPIGVVAGAVFPSGHDSGGAGVTIRDILPVRGRAAQVCAGPWAADGGFGGGMVKEGMDPHVNAVPLNGGVQLGIVGEGGATVADPIVVK